MQKTFTKNENGFSLKGIFYSSIVIMLLILSIKGYAQLQSWAVPEYLVSFNPNPTLPSVTLLPSAQTTNGASYDESQIPGNIMNSMDDVNGNLLFFVADEGTSSNIASIYDKDGFKIDDLEDLGNTNLEFGQEISIVPMPGSCSKYYLITTENTPSLGGILPVYAILDMSLPSNFLPGKMGALIYTNNTSYGQSNASNLYHNLVSDERTASSNYASDYIAPIGYTFISGISVVQRAGTANGSFYLFIYNVGYDQNGLENFIYRYIIDGINGTNGIAYDIASYDGGKIYVSTNADNAQYAEMEAIQLPVASSTGEYYTNTNGYYYRIACTYNNNNNLVIMNLDQNGNDMQVHNTYGPHNNTLQVGTNNNIKGLEFSKSGNYLYYSYNDNNNATGVIGYVDCTVSPFGTTSNPSNIAWSLNNLSSTSYTNSASLGNSFIEMGYNGKMYFNSGSELDFLTDPEHPTTSLWNSPNAVYFTPNQTTTLLPDQIDGYNYAAGAYRGGQVCCLQNTADGIYAGHSGQPSYAVIESYTADQTFNNSYTQTWTPTNNPFGGYVGNSIPVVIVKDKIIIPPGYTITIQNMTFLFQPETSPGNGAKVLVENNYTSGSILNGGYLSLNNTKFTSYDACGAGMWEGVEVWGDQYGLMPQSGHKQGYLQMTNYATISNAFYGVTLGNKNGTNIPSSYYGGGEIYTNGAKFINNQIDVYFSPYNGGNGQQVVDNLSNFRWTSFETDNQLNASTPVNHVQLNQVNGIHFDRCSFTNNVPNIYPQNTLSIAHSLTGILSFQSQFYCEPAAYNSTNGCSFTNLRYGIYASFVAGSKTATVNYCTFADNTRGVYLHGATLTPTIINSTFSLYPINTTPGTTTLFKGYGLYLDACDAYKVEANSFTTNYYYTSPNTNIGIVVNNSGGNPNKVYRNTFNQIWAGIQAQNMNCAYMINFPHAPNYQGLHLLCNTFSTTKRMDMGITSGCMDNAQGINAIPAGNTFSHGTFIDNDYFTYSTTNDHAFINYVYNSNIYLEMPINFTPPPGIVAGSTTSSNTCPTTLSGNRVALHIADIKYLIYNNSKALDSVNTLISNGSAKWILDSLNTTFNAGNLKDSMLAKSPYLSDDILAAMIKNTTFTEQNKVSVLLANSPLTARVMDTLNAISISSTNHLLIDSAQTGVSGRQIATEMTDYFGSELSYSKNDLLRANLNDNTITSVTDTIIKNINSFQDDGTEAKLLAALYSDKGNFTQADSIITMLDTTTGKQNLAKILSVYNELKLNGQPWESVITDSALEQKVREAASDSTLDGYAFAISVLQQVFGTVYFEPIDDVIPPQSDKSLVSKPQAPAPKKQNGYITCYPNPASETVNFSYTLPRGTTQGIIDVYNSVGEKIQSMVISKNQGVELFDLTKQANGLYFYTLLINGSNIDKGKFVINK